MSLFNQVILERKPKTKKQHSERKRTQKIDHLIRDSYLESKEEKSEEYQRFVAFCEETAIDRRFGIR